MMTIRLPERYYKRKVHWRHMSAKPPETGIYEVCNRTSAIRYSYWNGEFWEMWNSTPERVNPGVESLSLRMRGCAWRVLT